MRRVFQIAIGLSALFIAGCSAYFSVLGLGLLFVGSAAAVMVMAASLELGKLIATSFLYQYWHRIGIAVRAYLFVAIAGLMCITSLGVYGYLARAYERTNSGVALLQQQIASVEREMADTQQRIDASRLQLGKRTDDGRQDVVKLQQQIAQAGPALEQSLARLEDRRKGARDKRDQIVVKIEEQIVQVGQSLEQSLARLQDRRKSAGENLARDIERLTARVSAADKETAAALASEDSAIAALNDRVAVLDRAVDAYTREGGANFFKIDSIEQGAALRKEQQAQRNQIATEIARHHDLADQSRAKHAADVEKINAQITSTKAQSTRDMTALDDEEKSLRKKNTEALQVLDAKVAAAGVQFTRESAGLDEEEKTLRRSSADALAAAQQQLNKLRDSESVVSAEGGSQIDAMYQRIRNGNEEIRRLREQIAATDVGSYTFVARAFNTQVDNVVKWLILIIVMAFDPLAVALTVGFNMALTGGQRNRGGLIGAADAPASAPSSANAPVSAPASSRRWRLVAPLAIILLCTGLLGGGAYVAISMSRAHALTAHSELIPDDSFAVVALRPQVFRQCAATQGNASSSTGLFSPPVATVLADLFNSGFDADADVYVFLKYPSERAEKPTERPVVLCGLVARVTDPVAAEAGLSRCAEAIARALRPANAAGEPLTRNRVMVQTSSGRYLDPQGGFLTFGLNDRGAVLLLEIEGDPARPCVGREMQLCLSGPAVVAGSTTAQSPTRHPQLSGQGAVSLWFDAARCFADMPKTPAAQARYQQLKRYLDFDLLLSVQPAGTGELNIVGQYSYVGERFREGAGLPLLDLLAKLGPSDNAGTPGRLMDRCADTLDFDSLVERLRLALTNPHPGGSPATVVVEKASSSMRDARFVLTARYDPKAGQPLLAAFRSLSLF